jgi:hypothetical protein
MPKIETDRKCIWVDIPLDDDGVVSEAEAALSQRLQQQIQARGLGQLYTDGSDEDWMGFSFKPDHLAWAMSALTHLLEEYEVKGARIEIRPIYEFRCDDLPDYQPGDCLAYAFQDGDFGAVIVLERNDDWTMLGFLDYKHSNPPDMPIFEARQWLAGTHPAWQGKPYLLCVNCYGGIEINYVGKTALHDADPIHYEFYLSYYLTWEEIPDCFMDEKGRGQSP